MKCREKCDSNLRRVRGYEFFAVLLIMSALHGSAAGEDNTRLTFTRDVAPIFTENCMQCHRPGGMGPMSLMDYDQIRPWTNSILKEVSSLAMPPWHADPRYGDFTNDISISDEQRETIVQWIEQGARRGDPKDMPPVPEFPDDWTFGEPDMIVEFPPFDVPAGGPDLEPRYVFELEVPEDAWVKAFEVKGNSKVLHHCVFIGGGGRRALMGSADMIEKQVQSPSPAVKSMTLFMEPGTVHRDRMLERRSERESAHGEGTVDADPLARFESRGQAGSRSRESMGIIGAYAAGSPPIHFPDGAGKMLSSGTYTMSVHYHPAETPETDNMKMALFFGKGELENNIVVATSRVMTNPVTGHIGGIADIDIPPGDPHYEWQMRYVFEQDANMIFFLPHMHFRGASMHYEATYPNGEKETLLSVPRYSYQWQWMYMLREPKFAPKGTVIDVTGHFDNSEGNPNNPDPTARVVGGPYSTDEMFVPWIGFSPVGGAGNASEPPGTGLASARLKSLDVNGDGLLQRSEVPERMDPFFQAIDSNGDGAIDAKELDAMIQRRQQR